MKILSAILLMIGAVVGLVQCDDANPDDIINLCDSPITKECVKEYFAKSSDCTVVIDGGEEKKPFVSENLAVYLPHLNVTVVGTEVELYNMFGDIETFYKDVETGNIVMSVKFNALKSNTPQAYIAVARDGMEPKVFTDFIYTTYPAVLTAVIPARVGLTKKSLDDATYSAYFESAGDFELGTKITDSEDPDVRAVYAGLLADLPLATQEIFSTKARHFFLASLQIHICDFGLPLADEKYDTTVFASGNDIDTTDESFYEEPCADSENINSCVKDFFENRGTCTRVSGDDEPVIKVKYALNIPSLNSTIVTTDGRVTELNANIEEFYINKKTNNLVMAVNFNRIVCDTPNIDFVVNQRGRQPIVFSDSLVCTFPIRITAVIPLGEGLTAEAMGKAYMSTYFTDIPTYEFGTNLSEIDDSNLAGIVKAIIDDPVLMSQDFFALEAPGYFMVYIQKLICDFGIKI